MNTLKVGQKITLKSITITPQIATVDKVGNTYVILRHASGWRERVALRDAHFKIENYRLYEETK